MATSLGSAKYGITLKVPVSGTADTKSKTISGINYGTSDDSTITSDTIYNFAGLVADSIVGASSYELTLDESRPVVNE